MYGYCCIALFISYPSPSWQCDSANNRDISESDHIVAVDPITQYNELSLPLVEIEGEV